MEARAASGLPASLPPLQVDGLDAIFAFLSFSSPKSSVLPGTGSRGCYKPAAEQGMDARASGRLCGSSSGCRFQLIPNTPRPPDPQRAFDGSWATPSPTPTPRRVKQVLHLLSNRNHRLLAPNRLGSVLKRSRTPRGTQKEPPAVRSRCLFFTFCLGNMPETWPVPSIPDHSCEGSAGHGRLFWQKIPQASPGDALGF